MSRSEWRVEVTDLSSRTSWQDLKDYMRRAGDVIYADVGRDRDDSYKGTAEFRSYGPFL